VATAEQWRTLAARGIQELLAVDGAATQPGMEAKLSDSVFPGFTRHVDPHHLTTARFRLLRAGVIEKLDEQTRGGGTVGTYVLAGPSKAVQRKAGRKRLLHQRYLSWSRDHTKWGAAPIPAALERVVHSSLVRAAPFGYLLLRPEGGGEVTRIAGAAVPGGRIDNAAFFTGLTSRGLPEKTALIAIEAKNVRQWIYPQTQELYQLLDKSAKLHIAHPDLDVLPVLVCRRAHYLTTKMAQHVGFHVIQTRRQYIRPAVAANADDRRKFEELNVELSYGLDLNEGPVDQMAAHFTKTIPSRSQEAVARWSRFVSHPDVPGLITKLRDDSIIGQDRTYYLSELSAAALHAQGQDGEWAPLPEEDPPDGFEDE
jgi:hypothetical protein